MNVGVILVVVVDELCWIAQQPETGVALRRAVDVEQFLLGGVLAVVERGPELPVAREPPAHFGERAGVARVPIGPARRGAGGAIVAGRRAVAVVQRQRAPQGAVGFIALLLQAERDGGRFAQVGL